MTTTITTKYAIGDAVFHASTHVTKGAHECPDCKGSTKWKAVSPAGLEYQFPCPRCAASYNGDRDLLLTYPMHTPSVRQLTIGSVRIDTASDDRPVQYMCVETGVGSGSIYSEADLFTTREEAERVADVRAKLLNVEVPWIAKQYDKSLSVSDYTLENAALKNARDIRIRHQVKLEGLFYDLRDAETIEAVKEILDGFTLSDSE